MNEESTLYRSFCKDIGPWKSAFMGHPSGSSQKGMITQIFGTPDTIIFAIYDWKGVLRQMEIKRR